MDDFFKKGYFMKTLLAQKFSTCLVHEPFPDCYSVVLDELFSFVLVHKLPTLGYGLIKRIHKGYSETIVFDDQDKLIDAIEEYFTKEHH